MANKINLTIDQGTDYAAIMIFNDASGNPHDITDWDFSGYVKESYDDTSILAEFTIEKTDAENGIISMSLTEADTKLFSGSAFLCDIMTTYSGTTHKVAYGVANINRSVTL